MNVSGNRMRWAKGGRRAFGVSVALIAVFALLPETGWVVRQLVQGRLGIAQPQTWFGGDEYPDDLRAVDRKTGELQRAAAKHPRRFGVQLAACVQLQQWDQWRRIRQEMGTSGEEDAPLLRRVWQMRERFASEPSLYANYLRYACRDARLGREIEEALNDEPDWAAAVWAVESRRQRVGEGGPPSGYGPPGTPPSGGAQIMAPPLGPPAPLPPAPPPPPTRWKRDRAFASRFLDAARQGEACDPGNAFFPTLRAVALLALRRDDQAVAALEAAARKPEWRDYAQDEAEGSVALEEEAQGRSAVIVRVLHGSSTTYAHYPMLREMGRVLTGIAIAREQAGHPADGLRIRRALARIGMRVRVGAELASGTEAGIKLTRLAAWRVGGKMMVVRLGKPPHRERWSWEQERRDTEAREQVRHKAHRRRYLTYLKARGMRDAADWYRRETDTHSAVHAVLTEGRGRSVDEDGSLSALGVRWLTGAALLTGALYSLIVGGLAAQVCRGARVRDAAPLGRPARFALRAFFAALPVATGAASLHGFLNGYTSVATVVWASLAALVTFLVPLPFLLTPPRGSEWNRRQKRKRRRSALRLYAETGAASVTLLGLFTAPWWIWQRSGGALYWEYGFGFGDNLRSAALLWLGAASAAVLLPLFVIVVSLIISVRHRLPASVGIAQGLRAASLPLAASFLFAFLPATLAIARDEARVEAERTRRLTHEGRYLASLVGKPWPGPTFDHVTKKEVTP